MRPHFRHFSLILASFFLLSSTLNGQTIKEKKEGLAHGVSDLDPQSRELLKNVNAELNKSQEELKRLYAQVALLYEQNAFQDSYQSLLKQINDIKGRMDLLDNRWRDNIVASNQVEEYGLWYQPDTSIEQLVIDYGSQDYVYVIPPDIAVMKLSVASNLPVPRSSWSEMLELILTQNGIGIQQVNPFLRRLYSMTTDQSAVKVVTNRRQDLELFPSQNRICFVLSPEPSDVRRIWFFLDKFVNHQNTLLQLIGRDILIIGSVAEIHDLLKLYDFAATNKGDKDYKLVSLSRIQGEEMAKILGAIFDHVSSHHQTHDQAPMEIGQAESNGLKVIILDNMSQALFLIGTREEIGKAEQVIREVDGQLGDAREKTIFWYTAKNSDAEELAQVLSRIYNLMVKEKLNACAVPGPTGACPTGNCPQPVPGPPPSPPVIVDQVQFKNPEQLYSESFYQDGNIVVNPAPVTLGSRAVEVIEDDRCNFIVDAKTNAIVMVVEADILPKIKDLLKKLDIPKKMVQIEVLLFEKKIANQTEYGLNLLRIGCGASGTHRDDFSFNDRIRREHHDHGNFNHLEFLDPIVRGITAFIISRPKTDCFPAFDVAYRFLLNQEDVQINASPSVLTMNQTPAKIAIVEEISINTGIYDVETAKGNTLKDAFTRAQYGITLEITPTIHSRRNDEDFELCDDVDYISLYTNVTFDTPHHHPGSQGRPNVTRRNIENEVLIPDGQTVILGGLRRKNTSEARESIPFIGEIPGLGKLFSNTKLEENSTEMFIFITPKIVSDPVDDLDRIRSEELALRPGDIPEFLGPLVEARNSEKNRLFAGTMRILLGPPEDRLYVPAGEYDGR